MQYVILEFGGKWKGEPEGARPVLMASFEMDAAMHEVRCTPKLSHTRTQKSLFVLLEIVRLGYLSLAVKGPD